MRTISFSLAFLLYSANLYAQISVATLVDLDASGGVTMGPDGMLYVSDFGPQLGPAENPTAVYRVDPQSGEYTVFAEGFDGASGAAFDSAGNFYQAEPRGNRITRINVDGSRELVVDGLNTPVGVQVDGDGNIYVCNCGAAEILKIDAAGERSVLLGDSELLACPNGLTMDDVGNLYAVTFAAGNVVKITPDGTFSLLAELPTLQGGPNPVGLGHITWHGGMLYVTAIGTGVIYRLADDGSGSELLVGQPFAFTNIDGGQDLATFSKPNGIAISHDGTRLFVNVSEPSWPTNPSGLHPASIREINGVGEINF